MITTQILLYKEVHLYGKLKKAFIIRINVHWSLTLNYPINSTIRRFIHLYQSILKPPWVCLQATKRNQMIFFPICYPGRKFFSPLPSGFLTLLLNKFSISIQVLEWEVNPSFKSLCNLPFVPAMFWNSE